jgi:hypothetical protein
MTKPDEILSRRPLTTLVGVSLLSLVAYLTVFGLVLQKPLTLGELGAMLERKEALAAAAGAGKVIVVAGSNGRFSHGCDIISQELGRPCINMSLVGSVAPSVMFRLVGPHIKADDLIYVPLEYPILARTGALTDVTGPWLWRNDRRRLFIMGWKRSLYAAFAFDLRFAIEALAETGLSRAGISRRTGVHSLNSLGDETSNTVAAGVGYRDAIARAAWSLPSPPAVGGEAEQALTELVALARARGARVVGGLPTTFNDQPIPLSEISAIEQVYRRAGADFVLLEGASQYPREVFFDTSDHLLIPARQIHSRRVAAALRSFE